MLAKGRLTPAGGIPETLMVPPLDISLESCRVAKRHPFAGEARSHNQSLLERFGASDNPEPQNLPRERVCVRPFRDPGEQDVRQGVYRDVFTTFPEGPDTDPRPRWRALT